MSPTLDDLRHCMEGAIPSIIATSGADGVPNVSYLSQVVMVDRDHIALSNQFFSKTAENLAAHREATVLVVDGRTCVQYTLDVSFVHFLTEGAQFDQLAARVSAGSSRVGLANVMRLRSVGIFRVTAIRQVPLTGVVEMASLRDCASLPGVMRVVESLSEQTDVDGVVDATLGGLQRELSMPHSMFLWLDEGRGQLTAIGSRGYDATGIGSDVALGEGVIGVAAATRQALRINDLSRTGRLSAAVAREPSEENLTRRIALPGLPDALSQIAVPIPVRGEVRGVLFAESVTRIAFSADDEAGLAVIARQIGAALALIEAVALHDEPEPVAAAAAETPATGIQIVYYHYDDSVFIDGQYAIKGVAGRLLYYMLEQQQSVGRQEFTNREIRLETMLRLPSLKDNLETRLLLLRRRLEEKQFPVRLEQAGRGRVLLRIAGKLILHTVSDGRIDPG